MLIRDDFEKRNRRFPCSRHIGNSKELVVMSKSKSAHKVYLIIKTAVDSNDRERQLGNNRTCHFDHFLALLQIGSKLRADFNPTE
jgi:hypothetical protein